MPPGHRAVSEWMNEKKPERMANLPIASHDSAPSLPPLSLSRTNSSLRTPISEWSRIQLTATSGHSQVKISEEESIVKSTQSYVSVVADQVILTSGRWVWEAVMVEGPESSDATKFAVGFCDKEVCSLLIIYM